MARRNQTKVNAPSGCVGHDEQLRYVVIELTGEFQPEQAGQLGFYISRVDDKLRRAALAPEAELLWPLST
ncbi:PDDEXK nuclease domain-containing protein [Cryobacterium zongtaii]|uniref:PDDEXK nuclease domain-containing protein n=1 Tax=Cryobacterium zongtaii TaxID=1259217 RepID=UPI0013FD5ADE